MTTEEEIMETKTENNQYYVHTHCYCQGTTKCCSCGFPYYDTIPVQMEKSS
jgi:hypothetical protein